LARSAEVDERHIQKHLGHASVEMTAAFSAAASAFA
jgi:integrase